MANRSYIAIRKDNGKIEAIYCHNDATRNAQILRHHYQTKEQATELVNLGDLSRLSEKPNPTRPDHTFDNPERGVTIAYYRDRNEKHHITHYKDEQAYYEDTQETAFLYKYGRWYQNGTPIATPKEEAETIRKERSKS